MEIIFWGTRGAITAPKADQLIFGAHTPCIEIKNGRDSLLFDAGFGIGRYSDSLSKMIGTYHLFFTHFHWDHVQGIGYFIPIFLPHTILHIYSPWTVERLKRQLDQYFDYSFGPFRSIKDQNLKSQRHFHSLTEKTITINGFDISYFPNSHEGNCYGYSIARHGKKIALLTDHETIHCDSYKTWGHEYDVVIHDAQYTDEEYLHNKRGYGHSSYRRALENSRNMGAKKVILTHHDPARTDDELLNIERSLRQTYSDLEIVIAREQTPYSL